MKKLIFMIVTIILISGLTTTVKAQINKASTNALANIVSAISLTKIQDLNFGNMTTPTADVDVVLSTSNTITTDAAKIKHFLTGFANASYSVSGEKNYTYTISLPTNITISKSGSNPMIVESFLARATSGSGNGTSGTLSSTGLDTFVVGATLKALSAQPAGAYTGSFDVLVVY